MQSHSLYTFSDQFEGKCSDNDMFFNRLGYEEEQSRRVVAGERCGVREGVVYDFNLLRVWHVLNAKEALWKRRMTDSPCEGRRVGL